MTLETDPPRAGADIGADRPADDPPITDPYAGLSLLDLYDKLADKRDEQKRADLLHKLAASPSAADQQPESPPPAADMPFASAARGLRECLQPVFGALPLGEVIRYLKESIDAPGHDIEDRLATQARVLDAVFGQLIEHAMKKGRLNVTAANAALKAQKHYRDTVRSLDGLHRAREKCARKADKK